MNWKNSFAACLVALASATLSPAQAQVTSGSSLWNGPYIGLNAGYAWGSSDARGTVPAASDMNFAGRETAGAVMNGGFDSDGAIGGLTIGVSRQTGQLVLGIEADFSAFGLDGKRDTGVVASVFQVRAVDNIAADWLATLRLRLGYAAGQSLIYATAGPAFSNISASRFIDWAADGCGGGEFSLNRCHAGGGDITAGWTIGGGLEHAISERWTAKAEYLYADFGEAKFTTVSTMFANQNIKHSVDLNMHIGRLGVNYKF